MTRKEYQDPMDILELSALDKKINRQEDIFQWQMSPAYQTIWNVLNTINEGVKSKPRNTPHEKRPIIDKILNAFRILREYLQDSAPVQAPQRFGNQAFRVWLTRVWNNRATILADVTDNPEAHEYFCQSFGSWTRIDFGTGHEFNFLSFITCLCILGLLEPSDSQAIVFDVFWDYWDLIVTIQEKYHQEPAGSHGAWGVDDYVALPFVFGSSQLIDHPEVTPLNVIDENVSKSYADNYIYCKWIAYIYRVKRGAFFEHSRMLYSIRNLPHFTKLNGGMLKMYKGEIMDRFLVLQHFRFGKLLKWQDEPEKETTN